jgi:hypothetical protein
MYFRRPIPGCANSRYFCGGFDRNGWFVVTRVQVSRPGANEAGEEIAEPAKVDMKVQRAETTVKGGKRLIDTACHSVNVRQLEDVAKKRCTKCAMTRPLTDFHKHTTSRDGRSPSCKFCVRAADQARKAA